MEGRSSFIWDRTFFIERFQQEISFVLTIELKTSSNGVMIGKLLFRSFFVAANYDENPFFVYEPISVPFNHRNQHVRLAQMPAYTGMHPGSRQFIRWSQEEATPCAFELMISCRITPAMQKNFEGRCIYQILTGAALTACRIEPYPEPIFIRRLGHYWVVSISSTTK